jgi:hypothetical protein
MWQKEIWRTSVTLLRRRLRKTWSSMTATRVAKCDTPQPVKVNGRELLNVDELIRRDLKRKECGERVDALLAAWDPMQSADHPSCELFIQFHSDL